VVVLYRRFGTTYQSNFQGSKDFLERVSEGYVADTVDVSGQNIDSFFKEQEFQEIFLDLLTLNTLYSHPDRNNSQTNNSKIISTEFYSILKLFLTKAAKSFSTSGIDVR
jgi:hypothetical protein